MKKSYQLPSMEHRFSIAVEGEETSVLWKGDFLYKRPTIGQRGQIDVMRSRLNGDLRNIDLETQTFHEALSYLRFTLAEYPSWWGESDFGASLHDGNVVIEVYNKVIDFEADWKKRVHGGDEEAVKTGSSAGSNTTAAAVAGATA